LCGLLLLSGRGRSDLAVGILKGEVLESGNVGSLLNEDGDRL
jgi:hypothetical protein